MVSSAIFLAAISVPSVSVVILAAWSLLLYVKYRALVRSLPRPPIPPLISTCQTLPSRRPLDHHLASSDAYSTLDRVSLERRSRPPSFLQVDPALTPTATDTLPRTATTLGRFSITTSTSKTRGSRVLVRNPSSSQNSHGTTDTGETKKGHGDDEGYVVIERTKRNRKSFGIGIERNDFRRNDDVVADDSRVVQNAAARRRSSTWTARDFEQIRTDTGGGRGIVVDDRSSKRSSLPTRRLSISLHHEQVPPLPSRSSSSFAPALPLPTAGPSPHIVLNMREHSSAPTTPFATFGHTLQPSPSAVHPAAANWRTRTLPPQRPLDPRLSASSQALFDLEVYAAGLSQPSTPSFSPLPLSSSSEAYHHVTTRERFSAPPSRVPSPPPLSTDDDDDDQHHRGAVVLLRPVSWVKRQTSSGTLPDRIVDRDQHKLSVTNPDELSRVSISTSSSTTRESVE